MEQYIPKSALVAELKKRIRDYWSDSENTMGIYPYALEEVIKITDTLEVKEVDLEKEIDDVFLENKCNITDNVSLGEFERIAKHFFELGLNAQHSNIGIPNIDDIFEEEGIDPNSKDAKIFKECYYMALEKLKAQKGEGV